ncbi:hypothetical protein ALC57_00357, partial [Trachymyrmex cornetzi]
SFPTHWIPPDLVRRKVEQGPVLVGNVLVLVSQIYLRTIVASHLSHSIVALHWKTTDVEAASQQQSDITKIFSLPYDLKEITVFLLLSWNRHCVNLGYPGIHVHVL